MNNINIFFVHGWAFDHSFWLPLQNEMKKKNLLFNYYFYDHGFFGKKITPKKKTYRGKNIFIVHSYGFNWLIKKNNLKIDLILNFFGSPLFIDKDKKHDIQKKTFQKMFSELQIRPKYVLEKFYINCGLQRPFKFDEYNLNRLTFALKELYVENLTSKTRRFENKIFSIFSKNDKILRYRKFDNYFLNPKHKNLKVLDSSSHAMPYLKPSYCCEIIEIFIKNFLKKECYEK
jgi:hypothetical protein